MATEEELASDYASSLADLTVNSKPLINMLTMLAEENVETAAAVIVKVIEKHLSQVLPFSLFQFLIIVTLNKFEVFCVNKWRFVCMFMIHISPRLLINTWCNCQLG